MNEKLANYGIIDTPCYKKICKYHSLEPVDWINCDEPTCSRWYHCLCVNVDPEEAEVIFCVPVNCF